MISVVEGNWWNRLEWWWCIKVLVVTAGGKHAAFHIIFIHPSIFCTHLSCWVTLEVWSRVLGTITELLLSLSLPHVMKINTPSPTFQYSQCGDYTGAVLACQCEIYWAQAPQKLPSFQVRKRRLCRKSGHTVN